MRTFYFNTGVRPYDHSPPVKAMPGNVIRGGTLQIPFDCADVPEGSVFEYASDGTQALAACFIRREMHNTNMVSKYAVFRLPPAEITKLTRGRKT